MTFVSQLDHDHLTAQAKESRDENNRGSERQLRLGHGCGRGPVAVHVQPLGRVLPVPDACLL